MNPLVRYFKELLSLHARVLFYPLSRIERDGGNRAALAVKNLRTRLKGMGHRFGYDADRKLFYVVDGGTTHYFAHRRRGFWLYYYGLEHRAKRLWDSYLLDRIELARGDLVIDCGANYADLWLTLRHRIEPGDYITFEPGRGEAAAVACNAPGARNNAKGLGNENRIHEFYVNDGEADSSLIEPLRYTEVVEVETVTLESYFRDNGLTSVKLLKLEAEGFEPEILEGAKGVLPMIDYIAVDGGRERGVKEEETFSFQVNFLTAQGFEMVGANFPWSRALFKRAAR